MHGPGPTAHSCKARRHPEDQDTAGWDQLGRQPLEPQPHAFRRDLAYHTPNSSAKPRTQPGVLDVGQKH